MQRFPLRFASSVPALMGLSLILVSGCVSHDGLGDPDGGHPGTGAAGTHGGSTTGGAGSTATGAGTGTAGTTAPTGTAGTTGTGSAGTSGPGKAGTGGTMCGPVCAIFCPYGNVLDAAGCPTCKCNPAPVCNPADCASATGAPPPAIPVPPPCNGKFIPPTCAADPSTGKCAWTPPICECPALACPALMCEFGYGVDAKGCQTCQCNPAPLTCTPMECGPGPDLPTTKCSNGTSAGAACVRDAAGKCGWTITKCPPPVCPTIACLRACPNGSRVDANGCQTCDCLEPQSCGTHGDWKSCTADTRCTWLQPGCGSPALSTPGCFARTDVGCEGDGDCANGRTCLKRVVNPCYNPGGGASCDACGQTQTVCL